MELSDRLFGILTGKIPNRLTYKEIKAGFELLEVDLSKDYIDFLIKKISKYNLAKNNQHFWVNVLLFLPLKDIPPLINNENESVKRLAIYRLRLGK